MNKAFYFLTFILFLSFCSGNEKNNSNSKKPEPEKVIKKKTVKKKEYPRLNNTNVVAFLTKYGKENLETNLIFHTSKGEINVRLFKDTPLHRANFIYLIKQKYFEGTVFYRVIKNFVVQGGNSDDYIHANQRNKIGSYTLPSEFRKHHLHKKGVLSAPRRYENNPNKRSAPFDFFFVHREASNLDNQHTAFGVITGGLDVVDKIAKQKTDKGYWPIEEVYLEKIEIIK